MTIESSAKNILFLHRFAVLFVLLFCVLLIPPYFEGSLLMERVWHVLFTFVLLWALYTVAGSRKVLLLAALMLIPTISSTWLAGPEQARYLAYIDNATNILYFGLICFFLASYIFTTKRVTQEVIFAAMCFYILLAVLWAAIYTNLELFYGNAFLFQGELAAAAGIEADDLFQHMIYYSFVTLSTLGYGDVIPDHLAAQNWAAMEAMIGQFYIAIVMARLVSIYTVEKEEEASLATPPD